MTNVFARRAAELREQGEQMIREADSYACQSWNERMWADGGPIDPSPLVDQAVNGGYGFLEIECSRCRAKRSVDLADPDERRKIATFGCVHHGTKQRRCNALCPMQC